MPSIIPWRTSPPSCAGTPQAPKLHRVPLPNKDPEDDIILFRATKDPATPAMPVRQIKTSNPSKPPPVLKSCLKKRDPSPSSSSTTSSSASSASSASYPRSPPPQFRSREDVAIYSESEASPTRHRGYHGRHLRSSDGAESDYEKTASQMRHSRSNLKNSNHPLSPAATHPITLHWSLMRYNPHMSRQCIIFDICLPPRGNIQDFYTRKYWAESDYLKLASRPALDEMLIRCEVGLVSEPWNIYVNRRGGIRIIDVFEKIYDSFSIVLNDDEKKKLNPLRMKYYDRAFRRRCAITPGLTLLEERKGMRRVDLLEGQTVFMGLELSASRDCWLLRLGSSPMAIP